MSDNRMKISEDNLDQVTGGMLHLDASSGRAVLEVRDNDMKVVKTYNVITSADDVFGELSKTYWSLEKGKRDNQMISILQNKGYIE